MNIVSDTFPGVTVCNDVYEADWPETEYSDLVGWRWDADHQSPPEPWGEPEQGSLRPEECAALAEVLSAYTTTPDDCWFCVWEGYRWPELRHRERRPG
jgi:hypothetical protein